MSYVDTRWHYDPLVNSAGTQPTRWWINYPMLPINNPPQQGYDVIEYLDHIHKLELENIELRKTVKDLQRRISRKRK